MRKIKKALAILLVLAMILCVMPPEAVQANATEEEKLVEIGTIDELRSFASKVNNGNTYKGYTVILTANIDASGEIWQPIGYNFNNYFAGSFNGKGFTISNLNISVSINAANILNKPIHTVGLFGMCSDASIRNLKIVSPRFSISNESGYSNSYSSIDGNCVYAGAVCGYASGTVIKDVTVTDAVVTAYTGAEGGRAYAGGIVGLARNGCDFSYCSVTSGSVKGTSDSTIADCAAGGIVGELQNEGIILRCSNYAAVNGGHSIGAAYTGGICGKSSNTSTELSLIRECFNRGNVLHTGSWLDTGYVGGIVGYSYCSVVFCYASGTVKANTNTVGGSVTVGGISGGGVGASSVERCAAICGTISGGTARYKIAAAGQKIDNAALSSISGSPSNDANTSYSKSSFNTSSPFLAMGWDFVYVWQQPTADLPVLRNDTQGSVESLEIVKEAIAAIGIIYAEGESYASVKSNIGFTPSPNDAMVTWTSSNPAVISTDGVVTRQESEVQVRITATVTHGEFSMEKIFVLKVLGTAAGSETEPEEWAMEIDEARTLLATMRGCKIKEIDINDPYLQVLTGINTDEDVLTSFMADFMTYLEVPGESAFLKNKMGDVVGLLKKEGENEYDRLVRDFSDGLVDSSGLNEKTIARKIIAIPKAYYDKTTFNFIGAYDAIKAVGSFSNDSDKTIYENAKTNMTSLGKILDFIVKGTGGTGKLSKTVSTACACIEMTELYMAYELEKQNAAKSYIKQYLDLREHFDKDSIELELFMASKAATSIRTDIEDIDTFCESLYYVYNKLTYRVEEEYKVIIKCPVDVHVYDQDGKLVGRVVDNKVDRSVTNALLITLGGENNDEKTIHIQDDEHYSFQLVGSDTGSMEVEVIRGNSSYTYENIPLELNKQMMLEVSSDQIQQEEKSDIILLEEGIYTENVESVDNQINLYDLQIIVCEENVFGDISMYNFGIQPVDTQLAQGADISNLLTLPANCVLAGYYTDLACTNAFEGSTMPASDLTLYAKCIRTDDRVTINTHPQDVTCVIGTENVQLSVDIAATVDYSIQWYKKTGNADAVAIQGATAATIVLDTGAAEEASYFAVIHIANEDVAVRTGSAKVVIKEKTVTASGTCGDALVWELIEDTELIISGTGAMSAYSSGKAPWAKYASKITSVTFAEGITSVSSYALENFTQLTSLTIPDTVTSIGEYALSGCTALKEITLPFVGSSRTAAGTYDAVFGHIFGRADSGTAQYYCAENGSLRYYYYAIPASLIKVTLTDAQSLPMGAFHNCSKLTQITLNDGIQTIGDYALANTAVTELVIPDSVQTINEDALAGCNALKSLTLPFVGSSRTASGTYDAVFGYIFGRADSGTAQYYRAESGSLYYYHYAIPSALSQVTLTDAQSLPMGAFHNCANLTQIVLNDGIRTIGQYALANIAVTELIVPDSVETIAEAALSDCAALETLTIPFVGASRNVTGTDDAVFGYIFGFANTGTVQYYSLVDGGLSGYYYAIPASVKNVIVTDDPSIALGAFSNCTMLSTVELMEATAAIENCAFFGVAQMEKLIIQNSNCSIYNSSNCIGISGTMYGHPDSTAESFASRYGIEFVRIVHIHAGGTATCSELAKCDDCGQFYGAYNAANHTNVVIDEAVAATCTATGLTEGTHCDACGYVIMAQTETKKRDHDYSAIVTAPTCTTGGYTTYTCDACSHSYTGNNTAATGHSYTNGYCSSCGAKDPDYVEVVVPTLTLNYPSLSFEDEILYNVYYGIDDTTSVVEMGLITFNSKLADGTMADAVDVIPGYVSDGSTYMAQSQGIPAKNLSDALYFKVYAKLTDGSYVYSEVAGYNAVLYANTVLKNTSSSAKAKSLVVAMLNYGAAAQEYFGYKTDSLMNANLTAQQQALVSAYDESMVQAVVKADASKVGSFVLNGGYSNIYPTVSFEGAFSINFYFTPSKAVDAAPTMYYWDAKTYASVDVLTPENATGVLTMAQDGSNWGAAVEGIAAKALDDTIYVAGFYTSGGVAYPTGVISYSLGNYCKTVAANGTAFGAATAVYGYYAKAYFN